MRVPLTRSRLWIATAAVVLLVGTLVASQPARAISRENLDRGLLASVQLATLDEQGKALGTCSGSVIDPSGLILTDWHCVGLTNDSRGDISEQGLKPGDLYNSKGLVVILPTTDPKQSPKPTYIAQVVSGTPELDIAIVRIVSMLNQGEPLPEHLPLVVQPLGDSDKAQIGDPVYVIGYPGVGGHLVTLTTGRVSGFDDRNQDGTLDSIKTDAGMAHGNSGGPVLNDAGEQIGTATWGVEEGAAKIDRMMMVNIAAPFVAQAIKGGGIAAAQPTPGTSPKPAAVPTAASGSGPFGPIVFGTDVSSNGELVGQATEFPSGTKSITAIFPYQGMQKGTSWGEVWQIDGKVALDQRSDFTWKGGERGTWGIPISGSRGPLPDGTYDLLLFVSGQQVQSGSFSIGSGHSQPKPAEQGVVVHGQIVDADTQRPIPGAALGLLKPGVTIDQFDQSSDGTSLLAAVGTAGADGTYQTAPGLARGQTYVAIVAAKGYQRRVFSDGLVINADDPNPLELKPLALKRS